MLSQLHQFPCLWYRYLVEERTDGNKWHTVSKGESEIAFILDDGSSRCLIDVEGAILTRRKLHFDERFRKTEWTLNIDDEIYALGEFITLGRGSRLELDENHDVNALLRWKRDQPGLLKRFRY